MVHDVQDEEGKIGIASKQGSIVGEQGEQGIIIKREAGCQQAELKEPERQFALLAL